MTGGTILLILGVLLCVSLACAQQSYAFAETAQGRIRGWSTESYNMFLGIPYGEAPVGKLRWTEPRPKAAWSPSTLDTLAYGPSCIQPVPFDPLMGPQSEDCLFLNVYAPPGHGKKDASVPVLVWMHGGGYIQGTFDVELTNGNLIIVTLNYRLGVLGYLGSSALRSRSSTGSTGNYGLQDQRLALMWVQKNIANFGGDPKRVLAVGESAGAGSVSVHLVAPASDGLFTRAAMESGAFSYWIAQPLSAAEAMYQGLMQNLGCGTSVACLESATPAALLKATPPSKGMLAFAPTIDGIELTDAPWNLMASGKFSRVPILAGSNAEDGWTSLGAQATEQDLRNWLAAFVGGNETVVNIVMGMYANPAPPGPNTTYSAYYWASLHIFADFSMTCPARRTARWAAQQNVQSYLYNFRYVPFPGGAGAYHSSEISFVFHVLSTVYGDENFVLHGETQVKLSAAMANYWAAFADTGSPHVDGAVEWPEFAGDADGYKAMVFDRDGGILVDNNFRAEFCDFWDAVGPPPQTDV